MNRATTLSAALLVALTSACASDEVDTWLDAQSCLGTNTPAPWLSETGCFMGESLVPVDTLLPYVIQAPLWSDGTEKRRYITLPKGAVLELDVDGNLLLPPGGVLIKEFILAERRVETRFVSRDLDGQWHFATYAWEDDGTDARLVGEEGAELVVGDETWTVPSLRDCLACHNDSTAVSIGFAVPQLGLSAPHPFTGAATDQLETLADISWVTGTDAAIIADSDTPLVSPSSQADLGERTRSYLHANCAFCHNGSDAAGLNLRYEIPLSDTGVCNARPEFGDFFVEGARLLVPGDPEMSLVLLRMQTELSSWRMPTVGTAQADPIGVELVREWISEQTDCP